MQQRPSGIYRKTSSPSHGAGFFINVWGSSSTRKFLLPSPTTITVKKRKKQNENDMIPPIHEPVKNPDFSGDRASKEHRKNWARLIQKIYDIDPITCTKCQGKIRIIAFVEDEEAIKKILNHLGLWEFKLRPPPKVTGQKRSQNTL
jgi:hypothetical protein